MPSFLAIASANRLVSPVSMTTIVDVSFFRAMPLFERFLETAFFPQLLFWVGFTILLDTIAGSATVLITDRAPRATAWKQ
ncbi:MAG: hypothetical protein DMG10_22325 [Acidobacteria bacterium]|nr:MAG: hypothetical protein DMG10_22325 [Acidobacteriota bacterium]PYV41272.1 MAG: hypothetical protein DMG09_05035 [Acidobacteriota bacterium]